MTQRNRLCQTLADTSANAQLNDSRLPQADVNLGGRSGAGGTGGEGEEEAPLQWADFHLLAKAFRWASCQAHTGCPRPLGRQSHNPQPLCPSHAHRSPYPSDLRPPPSAPRLLAPGAAWWLTE